MGSHKAVWNPGDSSNVSSSLAAMSNQRSLGISSHITLDKGDVVV